MECKITKKLLLKEWNGNGEEEGRKEGRCYRYLRVQGTETVENVTINMFGAFRGWGREHDRVGVGVGVRVVPAGVYCKGGGGGGRPKTMPMPMPMPMLMHGG